MLGKLIKHEWKETWKVGCLMLSGVALITFLGWLAFQTPMWQQWEYSSRFDWLNVLSVLTLMMYVIMLVVVNYGILIYLGVHFYRTMYTDQGYLTHTLPVTKHQILAGKILISSLWVFIILLSVYLSVFLLGLSMISAVMPEGYTLAALWREIAPEMEELLYMLREDLDLDIVRGLVMILVSSIISPLTSVTILFGAISVGQLVTKHRVLMALVSYIGITVVISIVNSIIQSMAVVSWFGVSMGSYFNTSMNTELIVSMIAAIGLYFLSWFITNRKLNLP